MADFDLVFRARRVITAAGEVARCIGVRDGRVAAIEPYGSDMDGPPVETGPDEVEPLLNLGLLYQKTGNREQALHYFTAFLEKAPREQYGQMFPEVRAAIRELRSGG